MAIDSPVFPSGMPQYRVTSGFADVTDTSRTAAETQTFYFPSADVTSVGVFDIVSESDVTPTLVRQLSELMEQSDAEFVDPTDEELRNYTVKVFISRDATYLQQAYAATEPAENELCLFLEDNSTDIVSDRAAYAKVGSDFASNLADSQSLTTALQGQDTWTTYAEGGATFAGTGFTTTELAELVRNGSIENAARDTWFLLIKLVNLQTIALGPVYSALGSAILELTERLRGLVRFEERQWDPEQPGYTPVLTEITGVEIESFEDLSDESIQDMIEAAVQALRDKATELTGDLKSLLGGSAASVFPPALVAALELVGTKVDDCVSLLVPMLDDAIQATADLGSSAFSATNAFLCGLWNSLVEAVLGIPDMIGYLLVVLGALGDALSNAETVIPDCLELIDEAFQALLGADWVAIFEGAMGALIEGISHFNLYALTAELTIERVAYFVGGLVGLVVEVVVGLFSSGGLKNVQTAMTKFGQMGATILDSITSASKQVIGAVEEFTVETLIPIARKVIALLRQGKQAVVKAIEALFAMLDDAARLAESVLNEIKKLLQLTDAELDLLEQLKLRFVRFAEGAASACMVTY